MRTRREEKVMNYRIVLNPMYIWKRLKELQGNLPEEYHMPMIVLLFDMAISFIMTGCSVKDYMLYEFYKLNHFGKRQFFTAAKADRWFKKYNDPILLNELKDKEKALIKFNKFINRDWCGVTSKNTESDYEEFIKKHKKAILKPLDECGGHGIYIAEINDLQKFRGYTATVWNTNS